MPEEDDLTIFAKWWLESRPLNPPFDDNVLMFDGCVMGQTLFREGAFQVQLFSVKPYTKIADHTHENVDSYEVYLGGSFEGYKNGENQAPLIGDWLIKTEQITMGGGAVNPLVGRSLRVRPYDSHGGIVGGMGALFLSIQHWKDGVHPSSAHLDWTFSDSAQRLRNYPLTQEDVRTKRNE